MPLEDTNMACTAWEMNAMDVSRISRSTGEKTTRMTTALSPASSGIPVYSPTTSFPSSYKLQARATLKTSVQLLAQTL